MKLLSKVFIIVALSYFYSYAECQHRLFTITAQKDTISGYDIISRLSDECEFSVILLDDNTSGRLQKQLQNLYIKDATLKEVFDLVLNENDLFYTFEHSVLKIGYLITKTFEVDILSTNRIGSSNTNIAITGERVSTGNGGATGQENTGGTSNAGIVSSDGYSFWDDMTLLSELNGIVTRPEDEFQDVKIIMNKGAGLITITGNQKQINRAESYLKNIDKRLKSQVLIDVNILSVKHTDSKSIGIDWSSFSDNIKLGLSTSAESLKSKSMGVYTTDTKSFGRSFNLGIPDTTSLPLSEIVNFLKSYGDVTSISNPKVMTLNNQPSIISVGNIFYYRDVSVSNTGGDTTINTTEDISYIPLFVGILLDITPSVYNDEIMLKINPSITKTTKSDIDKTGTALVDGPPNLETKQLSSVVKLKNGEKVVLGGLISRDRQNDEKKFPILGDIPLIGYAFKREEMFDQLVEMIIIITPHIMGEKEFSLKELGYSQDKIGFMPEDTKTIKE